MRFKDFGNQVLGFLLKSHLGALSGKCKNSACADGDPHNMSKHFQPRVFSKSPSNISHREED
jgi:hypothetical protein